MVSFVVAMNRVDVVDLDVDLVDVDLDVDLVAVDLVGVDLVDADLVDVDLERAIDKKSNQNSSSRRPFDTSTSAFCSIFQN